jgi:hypothetical protein
MFGHPVAGESQGLDMSDEAGRIGQCLARRVALTDGNEIKDGQGLQHDDSEQRGKTMGRRPRTALSR